MRQPATYGGQTAGERRDERRLRLLAAASELVGQGGWAALTVRQVCAAAGLTARYFYENFEDRDALALALFDDRAVAVTQRVLGAVDAAPETALDKARAAIGAFVAMVSDEPASATVLFAHADGLPALMERRFALTRAFAALVEQRGRDFYGLDGDLRGDTAAAMLTGGLAQTLLGWTSGELSSTPEALIEDCAVMFVAAGEAAIARARVAG